MNVRVEYDDTPIRHCAVQCPECERWFIGRDITEDRLSFESDIHRAQFKCPVCGYVFGGNEYQGYANVHIKECGVNEVYEGCLHRKEVWE